MADTKLEILDATQRVLQQHGYHGLTTERVATEAGVSQSLVHHYFETKTALVIGFLEYYQDRVAIALDRLRPQPPGDRLVAALSLFASNVDNEHARELYLAMCELRAYAGRYDEYQDALGAYNQLLFEFVVETVEDGIDDGSFTETEPESVARLLLAAVQGALFTEVTVGVDAVRPVVADALFEYVLSDLYVEEPPTIEIGSFATAFGDTVDPEKME